ncbi:MAG: hypothetical protein WBA22_05460 [Candidatus Methanofastidiosia archaeon]
MSQFTDMYIPAFLGIVGGILGVALYAAEGLVFGVFVGFLLGLIVVQIQLYMNRTPEPRMLPPPSGQGPVGLSMVIDFTDTKCNYCLSPENEVMYYCPSCKKPYCAKCSKRPEIAGNCPVDKKRLIPIPPDKKVTLRSKGV